MSAVSYGEHPLSQCSNSAPDSPEPLIRGRPEVTPHFLAAIVESSGDAILSKDLDGIITSWNKGAQRLFGYTAEEAIGKPVQILIPEDRRNEELTILERIRRGERLEHYETIRRRKDGSLVEISLTVSPIRMPDGTIVGASKIARDITERKRAHERQLFLIRELQHRTQNLFALIQSIANRSLVGSLARAKKVFEGRLHALAQAHAVLAETALKGAPLDEIIRRELAGFSDHLSVSGCDIVLNTPAAQQFALIIHELATNAVKYGALSVPGGRVSIGCDIKRTDRNGTFSFLWKENGGPPVSVPKRKGFGSVVLLDSVQQFGQHVKLDYEPQGLRYELRFPLSAIEASSSEAANENLAG